MKTIEIKEWKNKWSIKWTNMSVNMQDYNNPHYQDIKWDEREGGHNPKQTSTYLTLC